MPDQVIYKYPVNTLAGGEYAFPTGYKILSAGVQGDDELVVWVQHDLVPEGEEERFTYDPVGFVCLATGQKHELNPEYRSQFIDTIVLEPGIHYHEAYPNGLVFHVFALFREPF